MKQMNETKSESDVKSTYIRLPPILVLGFALMLSSAAMGAESTNNNSIVMAMYGFVDTKYSDTNSYTDDDYVTDLVQSVYGKPTGPDYSKENIYVDSLVQSIEGNQSTNELDFSNDDVYANHLVEVIMK